MRVDVPTLQSDRCKTTTQDVHEMARYSQLTYSHMGGNDQWDLCPFCWGLFRAFVAYFEQQKEEVNGR